MVWRKADGKVVKTAASRADEKVVKMAVYWAVYLAAEWAGWLDLS